MKTEAKVGLFVAIGLLFLFLLTTQVNRFANMGKKGYMIYGLLEDASGLEKNAKVKIKGVDAGYVGDLKLEGKRVKSSLFIYDGIKIPKDSIIELKQESLLGTKYISIIPGDSNEYLSSEDIISKQRRLVSFDETSTTIEEAAKEFKEFIAELREDIKGESGDALKKSIENLKDITAELKKIINRNSDNITEAIENIKIMGDKLAQAGEKFGAMSDKFGYTADSINKELPKILKRVDEITLYLRNSGKTLDKKLPVIMDKFSKIEDDLETILEENREPLNKTLVSAHKFFDKGGDSFKKIDKFLNKMGRSQIELAFDGYYMSEDEYIKNRVALSYMPSYDKSYILEVISKEDYSRKDENGNIIKPSSHEDSKYYFSAMYAKRYDNLALRLGLIESTGGAGVDYYFDNDLGRVRVDVYDFNAINDVRGDNAHLDVYLRYRFLKHLDAYLGVDNALNSKARNYVFGIGLDFIDQDLKYLLGTASGASSFIQ